jgi:hypothetical protein
MVAKYYFDHTPKMAFVVVTEDNYWQAVKGYDHPFVHPMGDLQDILNKKSFRNLAFEVAHKYTFMHISQDIPRVKPTYGPFKVNLKTSIGHPVNQYLDEKGEVPESWIECDLSNLPFEVFWLLAMKHERLPLSKILDRNKMRSFIYCSYAFLILQKIFCHAFNESMKCLKWSAYGFSWHYLGFHKIIERLSRKRYKRAADVGEWDKAFPLKLDCAVIREKFLDLTDVESSQYWWMYSQDIAAKVILPTGEVVEIIAGQKSGSENTTSDNTLAHILVKFYLIIKMYMDAYGVVPELRDIYNNFDCEIYSDDNLESWTDKYNFLSQGDKVQQVYEEFGFKLERDNPEKWKESENIEGLDFLGLKVTKQYGYYVPTYDYERVKDSTVVVENLDPIKQVERFMGLLQMLTFNKEYDEYREFILFYCRNKGLDKPYLPLHQDAIAVEMGWDIYPWEYKDAWVEKSSETNDRKTQKPTQSASESNAPKQRPTTRIGPRCEKSPEK